MCFLKTNKFILCFKLKFTSKELFILNGLAVFFICRLTVSMGGYGTVNVCNY